MIVLNDAGHGLHSILETSDPGLLGTVGAAVERATLLDSVTNDFATTVIAGWCQSLNSAFKGIKRVAVFGYRHRECFIVVISTYFTLCHASSLRVVPDS